MAVILRDVAKKAGVSLTTASMAIRDGKKVSSRTKAKVIKVARELGFRANASAQNLASGRVHTLGVVVQDLRYFGIPYISAIVGGIIEVCDKEGYKIGFARSCKSNAKEEVEYIRLAREGRFDGMIIIDQMAKESEIRQLTEMNIPVVLVDRKIAGMDTPTVRIDYRRVVKEATCHLIGLGHRRIATLPVPSFLFEFKEKLAGYKEALKENMIPYDHDLVKNDLVPGNCAEQTKIMVDKMLALPEPPTAYFCFEVVHTAILCDVLRYLGVSIPEISVIGCELDASSHYGLYSIGAIKIPNHELGVRVCQVMLGMLNDWDSTTDVILNAKFDPKMSCAPPYGM